MFDGLWGPWLRLSAISRDLPLPLSPLHQSLRLRQPRAPGLCQQSVGGAAGLSLAGEQYPAVLGRARGGTRGATGGTLAEARDLDGEEERGGAFEATQLDGTRVADVPQDRGVV